MKRRPLLIGVAVLLALLGTIAVYAYVHSADSRAVSGMKASTVLIVTKEIPAGTPWSAVAAGGYVSSESVPASAAPASGVTSTSAVIPATEAATFAIAPGQIVVREMFGTKTATTGVLSIPGKLQAISIALGSSADVGGFVQVGSQVAVYAVAQTARQGNPALLVGGQQYSSKLLLPRVSVLAVSQSASSSSGGLTGASNASNLTVTLAVTQQQAERLVLAQKVGDLYLSLLSDSSASAEDGGQIGFGLFNPSALFTK